MFLSNILWKPKDEDVAIIYTGGHEFMEFFPKFFTKNLSV